MSAKHFELNDFIKPKEAFHLARVRMHSRQDLSLHSHDYAEVFWVESGQGWHHVNNQKIRLSPGNLVMVRPGDKHTFSSSGDGITIMNLAFPKETLQFFKERYFSGSNLFFWSESHIPYQAYLPREMVQRISSRAEQSLSFKKTNIQLDALLLFIFRLLTERENVSDENEVPVWLQKAIQQFNSPDRFNSGPKGFANLCDRNIDHVNRTVKKIYGKSLTEFVNERRMIFAAQQLSITNNPIKTICNDCGLDNMSYFYKVFKKHHNLTPVEFRKINQRIV